MDELSYLDGKVRKYSLPQVEPGQAEVPILKRLMLKQGELAQFYDSDDGVRYLAMIELKLGTVRGNHYHLRKDELIYMISGRLVLRIEEPATRVGATIALQAGDVVFIPPGIAHALHNSEPGFAVEASKVRYEPEDVCRYTIA